MIEFLQLEKKGSAFRDEKRSTDLRHENAYLACEAMIRIFHEDIYSHRAETRCKPSKFYNIKIYYHEKSIFNYRLKCDDFKFK